MRSTGVGDVVVRRVGEVCGIVTDRDIVVRAVAVSPPHRPGPPLVNSLEGRRFGDRADAGRRLASRLAGFATQADVVILALPRGGVPVAFEVALALDAPLDVFPVRKLGVPGHEELGMGAVALGGMRVLNRDVVEGLRLAPSVVEAAASTQRRILEERSPCLSR